MADQLAANEAHFSDAKSWRAEVARRREEADARAREEAQRLAAEAKAKADQLAAEAGYREAQAQVEELHARKERLYTESASRSMTLLHYALKDPGSADFQSVQINRLPGGKVALCGYLNARNSFGGYTGYKRFVVAADLEIAEVEGVLQNYALDNAWNNYCNRTDEE